MHKHKLIYTLVSLLTIASLLIGSSAFSYSRALAMPVGPTDESKVPHYFGPNPNWANSPFTLPDAQVVITGDGSGAAAVATVGANGIITGISVTNPGHNYSNAKVDILGSGTGAMADVTIVKKGAVVAVTVDQPGTGYTAPSVTFSAGLAAATAYGGVENNIQITNGGSGYQMPTVDFDMPDSPDGVQAQGHVPMIANGDLIDGMDANGTITAIVVDNPGSGYSAAPGVAIHNGTLFDPIPGATLATASATLSIQAIVVNVFGAGYNTAPVVTITDLAGLGNGALATAVLDNGIISAVTLKKPGSGYLTAGGIQKFTDPLPGLCVPPACSGSKYIPLAMPEAKNYNGVQADEYEIGLVQYRTSFSSSLKDPVTGLPVGTLVRGYVQLETPANAGISQHFPLVNELLNGTSVPVMQSDGVTQWLAVTPPQYLGPVIAATKNKPVRIVFYNLLPTDAGGNLFLPVDTSLMGSGTGPMGMLPAVDQGLVTDEVRNPLCSDNPQAVDGMGMDLCFQNNRATLHLHGGISPWISDGTAHQWITPAGEMATWPEGVSVESVPDMNVCQAADDGCMTFYYTNQQSARLMFYHDHAWGITRLNVYAGEAAGYLITDDTEKGLLSSDTIPGAADTIPLIIQDKTFVPQDAQMYNQYDALGNVLSYGQDPAWDASRWGGYGELWYHHVYMPAQNPGDPGGMSAYGRWMYGPWFWPPAAGTVHGPIANPYYNMDPDGVDNIRGNADDWQTPLAVLCNLDDPATWQYQTDPFCEPQQIPGTPNVSVGMEQFNDTPVVNGVAYPTLTLEPKTYRFRILSAANDRFFNFQWYVGDASTASTGLNLNGQVIGATEVALNPAELALAQTDPVVFPTPDLALSPAGPDWIQIGSEGGFLPAPVMVDGQQYTTWITDPTRFDVGNVDLHSLLLAPAERADVIVDFSQFAGQTLILYNDAPAAFPARVPSYDYYTGAPDMSPVGAPAILPGYGPNTRTIMQVKIAAAPAAPAFNLAKLQAAFKHKANGTGVFESGQHPIIVGQAAYNSAYGTSFAAGSNCNAPGSTVQRCDGFVRVSDTTNFGFNTLKAPNAKMTMPLQPKAIHDEMNSSTFDEFGRMQANLGVEAQPPTPGAQNVVLYPFVNPSTELIDATNLPKAAVTYDANGLPVSDVKITPISNAADGTQIWRITHNGVDTHPIHFHLYDVQVVNRVTWDNIIIPAEATELGWKDTVRISPLEDTIVALRPIIPQVPFEVPNAIRALNPMMPAGSTAMFNNVDANGNPTDAIINQLVNFGWEYVYHCHILSHEEMDMMRPVSVALPPIVPDGLVFDPSTGTLTWNDNSITETSFAVQRSEDGGITWLDLATIQSPLDQPNLHEVRSFTDLTFNPLTVYKYRVVAKNTVGYGGAYMSLTVQSVSAELVVNILPPAAPTNLSATLQAGPQIALAWSDNATNETGFVIERALDGVTFSVLGTVGANTTSFVDSPVSPGITYTYQVQAVNLSGASAYSNQASVSVPALPADPTNLTASAISSAQVDLAWSDNATNEDGTVVQRSIDGGLTWAQVGLTAANAISFSDTSVSPLSTYSYQVYAFNLAGSSLPSNVATATTPDGPPVAPSNLSAANLTQISLTLNWQDNSNNEANFTVQMASDAGFTNILQTLTTGANVTSLDFTGLTPGTTYYFQVAASNAAGTSAWSAPLAVTTSPATIPAAPSNMTTANNTQTSITLNWVDNANNEAGFTVQIATNNVFTANFQTFTVGPNVTSWNFTGLTRNTKYYFRVAAFNAAGTSAWAAPINDKTLR